VRTGSAPFSIGGDAMATRRLIVIIAAVVLLTAAATLFLWVQYGPRRLTVTAGAHPEEIVYVRSADDIINAGVMFTAPKASATPVAVIWIHGWGVNFYYPTYVMIGRALAARGYTTVTVNTRMHDLGTVAGRRDGKRVRGGAYWGAQSEQVRDLAAWVDFAEERGFRKVVLVGHSAGWAVVRAYQAESQDPRVAGVVLASGPVRVETREANSEQLAEAERMMAEGRPEDLVRDPRRSFPAFTSARTFIDIAKTPPEYKDFFGVKTSNPGVTRITCPLLAFFGTREPEVGTEETLELLRSAIGRHPRGPRRVDTAIIVRADHMYTGEEQQVAETIARWAESL
jgi:pimeloyl-ACP methyl ester carboxylesterase